MEVCIIIYLDLVGYSTMKNFDQGDFFKKFQKQIHHILYDEIIHYDDEVSLIPTGDGMIITLIENGERKRFIKAFEVVEELYTWIKGENLQFRCAIHNGDVIRINDINKVKNVIGNSINDAARMLSGVSDGDIVVSEKFFNDYLVGKSKSWGKGIEYEINENYKYIILDEDIVIDKHSSDHQIYSIKLIKNNSSIGEKGKILNKYKYDVYSNDYPKIDSLNEIFKQKIKNAEKINLIGIYNPSVPKIIENVVFNEVKKVEINIYYAADNLKDEIESYFDSNKDKLDFQNKQNSISKIKNWYEKISDKNNIKINIYEYSELLSFGCTTLDLDIQNNGFMHISNYVKNIIPEETPYINIEWKTREMPPLYRFYHDYLNKYIFDKCQIIEKLKNEA